MPSAGQHDPMADLVNGGIIILMAAFGLVAVVGAADGLRGMAGPGASVVPGDAAVDPEPSLGPEQGPPIPLDLDGDRDAPRDDDRGDKRDHGKRDRHDDRHGHDKDDD